MAQRAKANSRQEVAGQVGVRRFKSSGEWTEEEARDLLRQGYSDEQVARVTGYDVTWVQVQSIPREPIHPALAPKGRPE